MFLSCFKLGQSCHNMPPMSFLLVCVKSFALDKLLRMIHTFVKVSTFRQLGILFPTVWNNNGPRLYPFFNLILGSSVASLLGTRTHFWTLLLQFLEIPIAFPLYAHGDTLIFPTLLSSIWTVFPGPPILKLFLNMISRVSLQKLSKSRAVLGLILSCRLICHWLKSWYHQYANFDISSNVKLVSSNQVPLRVLNVCLWRYFPACFRHSHLNPSERSSFSTSDIFSPHLGQFCYAATPVYIHLWNCFVFMQIAFQASLEQKEFEPAARFGGNLHVQWRITKRLQKVYLINTFIDI